MNPAAALVGAQGMAAVINDNIAMYVTDQRPEAEARYRFRFYFDPNAIAMTSGDAHFIFYGYQGTNTVVSRIEFRRLNSSYQLRAAALNDPPTTGAATWRTTSFFTISDAPHFLEVDWQAATAPGANNGSLTFWIDGVQRPSLTGLDNDTRRIDIARLGPIGGIDTGTRGAYYFDAFESRRRSYIGPVAGGALAAEVTTPTDPLTTTVGMPRATASLSAERATVLIADVAGLGLTVTFPAIASSKALTAQVVVTDTQTLPDGYALLGEMVVMQTSAPIIEPITVSINYGGMALTVASTTTLTLQRWNAATTQWEVLPVPINMETETITATVEPSTLFALWQQVTELLPEESTTVEEQNQEIQEQFSIYLPLIQE